MSWTPHSLPAAGSGKAKRFLESSVEAGPVKSCSPPGYLVEELPEQIEVGAAGRIYAAFAAETEPQLLQNGPGRCCRERVSQIWHRREGGQDAFGRFARLGREQIELFAKLIWYGSNRMRCIVCTGDSMKFGKAKAAPRRAQNAKPRNSVFGIEHGAGERSGIQNFGTIFQVLKFDGTKWEFLPRGGQTRWGPARCARGQVRQLDTSYRRPGRPPFDRDGYG